MTWVGLIVAASFIGLGLVLAARARAPGRARETLTSLGFKPAPPSGALTLVRSGRVFTARPTPEALHLGLPLAPAPLPYEVQARALGRGALLGALFRLRAEACADRLEAELAPGLRPRALERALADLAALADALESLPRAEAMARWFLDLATGEDRAEALQRLLAAHPDAPETLAACRTECDLSRDARAAAMARAHLAVRQPAPESGAAGRPPAPDV